jgi:hypothetical protein
VTDGAAVPTADPDGGSIPSNKATPSGTTAATGNTGSSDVWGNTIVIGVHAQLSGPGSMDRGSVLDGSPLTRHDFIAATSNAHVRVTGYARLAFSPANRLGGRTSNMLTNVCAADTGRYTTIRTSAT